MYGYVTANGPELKVREQAEANARYCGLCSCLKKDFGRAGQLTITHDMTFLVYLLNGLYEPKEEEFTGRCILHPLNKRLFIRSEMTEYAAEMNVLLAWFKLIDDWKDEKKLSARAMLTGLHKKVTKVIDKYPDKARVIKKAFKRLSKLEKEKSDDLDALSGEFGKVMAEVCDIYGDEWSENLRAIGFSLGKFIYIMDAYDDLEEDRKKGNFNCLEFHIARFDSKERFDNFIYDILNAVMADCARNFEMLPITKDAEVLRNIIYAGVWNRWEEMHCESTK